MVTIGIDPHKRTHIAVAIDRNEEVLGERLVRATARQVPELLRWAGQLDDGERIWAVESAGGLGYLLASSFWPPVRRWSISRPRWHRGCGCWARGGRTRTT
jgi:hypothetical protein